MANLTTRGRPIVSSGLTDQGRHVFSNLTDTGISISSETESVLTPKTIIVFSNVAGGVWRTASFLKIFSSLINSNVRLLRHTVTILQSTLNTVNTITKSLPAPILNIITKISNYLHITWN